MIFGLAKRKTILKANIDAQIFSANYLVLSNNYQW